MKTLNDIRRQIGPCLQKIEEERKSSLAAITKAKQLYIYPGLLSLLAVPILVFGIPILAGILFIFGMVGCVLITVFKILPHQSNYITNFKKEVFSSFTEALYPHVYYAPGNYVPRSLFNQSELFHSYNKYSGEDYFEGKTESGHSFKFSELSVQSESTTTDNDGHTTTSTTTVFSGLFFVLDVPNRVNGRIQVLPDTAESTFGKMGKFLQENVGAFFNRSTMVYMKEHPEFEKEFVVYGKDEEEVYRILTPNLLQAIYELRYKWKTKLSISFIGHQMYIAMPTSKNFFYPDLKRSVLEDKLLQELYDELALCFSVVEDLSLEHEPNESRALLNSKDNPFLL